MKKYLFIFMVMAMSIITYAQVEVLNENFDGCAQPAGWTTDATDAAYANDIGTCGSALFSFDCTDGSDFSGDDNAAFSGCIAVINDDDAGSGFVGTGYIISPAMDLSANGGDQLTFDWTFDGFNAAEFTVDGWDGANWTQLFSYVGDDAQGSETIAIGAFNNADFQVRFAYDDGGSWNWGVGFDNVVVTEAAAGGGGGGAACTLDCPGDIEHTLQAGECDWFAEYNARTEGDCVTDFDSILVQPGATNGFNGAFDPTGLPEWDLTGAMFSGEPTLLNGPAAIYNTQVSSMIALSADHNTLVIEDYDEFSTCPGNGTDANYNITFVSFIVPNDGTITFDWSYQNDDDWGPDWDPFGYMVNGTFTQLSVDGGSDSQNGAGVSAQVVAGDEFGFYVMTADFDECGSAGTVTNFSFVPTPPTDGIYLTSGPALGEALSVGEYAVELSLYEGGQVTDQCNFDITVKPFPSAIGALACNDNVPISVDENCIGMVTADMILEGGPYGCYDDYRVEIFSSMPANITGAIGDIDNPVPMGSYVVGVYDDKTGNNCWSTITVLDKIAPTIECACPEGGDYPAGAVIPEYIFNSFSETDGTFRISVEGWDFGELGQIPEEGEHYYDTYKITVSADGNYFFLGSDINKEIVGVFEGGFNPINVEENLVGGFGGYVNGSSGVFYKEPRAAMALEAGVVYTLVISDFDKEYTGDYKIGIFGDGVVTFAETAYGAGCEFAGCYEEGVDYDFKLPEFSDNCSANLTWTETVRDGENCGTYIVTRDYTVTDGAGMTATCSSDYFFKGIDLVHMEWPVNWDDVPGHNPMLECNTGYPVDANGNPDPEYTGAPAGFSDACGTIEVFYKDQTYPLVCGTKIFREWTVVDDCTGDVYQKIQLIRITDRTAPTFMAPEDLRFKTKAYVCNSDIEVPALMHLADNCDAYPRWYVTTNAGTLVGDDNGNGFVDAFETWTVLGVPLGTYELCYHAVDNCGNESEAVCVVMEVFDGVPPIPVCEQYKQVSLTAMGNAKVNAVDFNSGSFDNCNPVHFKVLRTDAGGNYDGGCADLNSGRYDDDVFFCCPDRDVEGGIMVSLRVFDVDPGPGAVNPRRYNPGNDLYGHYNDCMSFVTVDCKIPPVLTCSDVTVTCEESLDPFVNTRLMPQSVSVCGLDTIYYSDRRDDGVCGAKITRVWTAYGCDMPTTCRQKITVEATEEFDPCTIKMPADVQADCADDLGNGGEPKWDENPCNVVTAEIINEDTFTFVDGACYKIVREWAVIDWCVYEPNTGAENDLDVWRSNRYLDCTNDHYADPENTGSYIYDGYYRYTQILMMTDSEKPTITVEDQCVATTDCYAYDVEMTASATDSCNVNQKFNWKYIVTNMDTWETVQYSYNYTPEPAQGRKARQRHDDLDRTQVATLTLKDPLPEGHYRVIWTVGDGCGNANSVNQYFDVADKKAPTPIMVDIATAVMTNGMVELKARTFDKGGCDNGCISSLDNCTPKDGLYFTFTEHVPHLWENPKAWEKQYNRYGRYFFNPNTGEIDNGNERAYLAGTAHAWLPGLRTSQKAFVCEAYDADATITETIKVYVWDKFDDATDKCDDNNFDYANVVLSLKGCVNPTNPLVSGMVTMVNSTEGISDMVMTAATGSETKTMNTTDGSYSTDVLENKDYTITGEKNTNFLNGVTTLDIVLIQKHLLGIKAITNPYSLIAADANGSGDVSASDILQIRKVILGSKDRFDNSSWLAIAPDYTKSIVVPVSTNNVANIDFTAVKIGDVNGSANTIQERSASQVNIMLDDASVEAGELVEVPFYAKDFSNVYGAQFTMNLNNLTVENIVSGGLTVDASNINVVNNNLVMSWNNANGVSLTDGDVLFTLTMRANTNTRLSESMRVSDNVIRAEAYTGSDLEVKSIKIGYRNADTSYALYQNEPNPFADNTVIGFDLPKASNYTMSVYDVTGKKVMVINNEGQAGYNTVTLSKKDLRVSGVLYYKLESGDYTATKKMVIIK